MDYKTVRDLFVYNESEGGLLWRNPEDASWRSIGYTSKLDGYVRLEYRGKMYFIHRLVFLWHKGYLPEECLHHIDGNRANNKIENLAEATFACNIQARGKSGRAQKVVSAVAGVGWCSRTGKWQAKIGVNRKSIHLKRWKTFTEAAVARWKAEVLYGFSGAYSTSTAFKFLVETGVYSPDGGAGKACIESRIKEIETELSRLREELEFINGQEEREETTGEAKLRQPHDHEG